MRNVSFVEIPDHIVFRTQRTLRDFGRRGCEGLVLWLGDFDTNCATIREIFVPTQESISDESGVGYFVNGETLFELQQYLSNRQLRLIAQVHSHPGHAYHSSADDAYAIVTREGGLSFVVPDFAVGPAILSEWAAYRLCAGRWTSLTPTELALLTKH